MTEIIGYPDYTINEKGEIYNKKKKIIMKQTLNSKGYFYIGLTNNKIRTLLLVHRLLYQMFKLKTGETMPETIDHKNRIKTNNSLDNLRGATSSENNRNVGKYKINKSGHKDICITKCGTFEVRIGIGNGKTYSKTFKILEEAIIHRDIKLKEFHGEFANNGNQIAVEIIAGSTGSTDDLNFVCE